MRPHHYEIYIYILESGQVAVGYALMPFIFKFCLFLFKLTNKEKRPHYDNQVNIKQCRSFKRKPCKCKK